MLQGEADDGTGWRIQANTVEKTVIGLVTSWIQKNGKTKDLEVLIEGDHCSKRDALTNFIERVDVSPTEIAIRIRPTAISGDEAEGTVIRKSIALRRRGVERRIVIAGDQNRSGDVDADLCRLIGQAHTWMKQLTSGEVPSVDALGEKEGRHPADVSRILQLSFLAPDIVKAILQGRQPIELNSHLLTRLGTLPSDWHTQRRLIGFEA